MAAVAREPDSVNPDGVRAIAAAVSGGRRLAADVLVEHVERCRVSHHRLNALVQPRFEVALREAQAATPAGVLAGVPVSVKECFAVSGLQTTLGIRGRMGCRDVADADVVRRLRAAGAIVVVKANVPQALYLHETDNPVWGRTLHPTRADRGPGGSSGGDAALVAAGCVPLAVGNDLAGSIRQPAHACGIVGLLPRRATIGGGGAFETMPGLPGERSRVGILGRTVDDVAVGMRALVAKGEEASPIPATRPLRIGWWDRTGPMEPSPAISRAVAIAAERLRVAGAVVEPLEADIATEAAWIHLAILSADGGADIRRLFAGERPVAQVRRLLALAAMPGWGRRALAGICSTTGRRLEAAALRRTGPRRGSALDAVFEQRQAIAGVVEGWSMRHDVILSPVSALPALRHGTASRLVLAAAPCLLANLVDLAAGTVPVTTVASDEERGRRRSSDPIQRLAADTDIGSAGLPVGVQLVSLHRAPGIAEEVLLRAMRDVEIGGVSP